MQTYAETDARFHARQIQTQLEALIQHMRQDIEKVDDPKAQALFETSAEVLTGLKTAYIHYEQQAEEAWR